MNICLITPVYSSYTPGFISSFLRFFGSDYKFDIVSPVGGSNITAFRNTCIQNFYELEEKKKVRFDKILWIDADMRFSMNDVKKLIDAKKDVISGLYFMKNKPFKPNTGYYDLNNFVLGGFPAITKEQVLSNKIIEVDWAGLGFTLHTRKVFDDMKNNYPWFEMRIVDLPEERKVSGNIVIKKELLSEDITFFTKIKELGYKIHLDTSVVLGHDGTTTFSKDHFLACN